MKEPRDKNALLTGGSRGIVRAIKQDSLEVLFTARPTRPLLAVYALWPAIGNTFLKWVGVMDMFRRVVAREH